MMNGIAVFLTLLLSSGVIAALIGASFNEAKERWVLRRSKIEEIYLSGAGWLKETHAYFLPYLQVCRGNISHDQMRDLQKANAKQSTGDHYLRMEMSIKMYERCLLPALSEMEKELARLNEVCSELTSCYSETGQASQILEPLRNQLLTFAKAGDVLLEAVVSRGAQIGAERNQIARAYDWMRARTANVFRGQAPAGPGGVLRL